MTAVPATVSARVRARRIAIGVVAVCAGLATSACAAGRHATTAEERPAVDANSATVGRMELRGVAIAAPSGASYASGSSAELLFLVVNSGQTTDTLTGVTTQGAGSASVAAASSSDTSSSASDTSIASASASDSASASGSASSGSSGASAPFTPVDIPAGSRRSFGLGDKVDYHLTLSGLTQALYGGSSVRITFTFAKAGSVTVTVPVQLTVNTGGPVGPVVTAGESAGETPAQG